MNTVTVIPAVRVSEQVQPEFRVFSHEADALQIDVLRGGCILLGCTRKLTPGKTSVFRYSLKGAVGDVELRFRFYRGEKEVETSSAPYQVVPGSVPATGLIDGCWISICHWSEQEAVFFNSELKKMRDEDFERHIEEMSLLGIRGVVIQNVFDSSHYVGRHEMTCGSYDGRAFYPSGLYPGRMPLAARDPIEAVLRAADRCGCMCCWVWACSPGLIFRNSRWNGTGALHGSSFSGMEAMRPSMAGMFQKRSWETCIIRTCRTPQSAGRSLPCSFASSVLLYRNLLPQNRWLLRPIMYGSIFMRRNGKPSCPLLIF